MFVFSDKIERSLTIDYNVFLEKWNVGAAITMLYQTDKDSSDGRGIGNRATRGLNPLITLGYKPIEKLSIESRLQGEFEQGYRSMQKYIFDFSVLFAIKMFTLSGSACAETEKTPFYNSGTLQVFLDMSMRI